MKSLAYIISYIFNPVLVIFLSPYFLLRRFDYPSSTAVGWSVFTLFFLIIACLFVYRQVKKKVFSDMDVSVREQRPLLFITSALISSCYLLCLFFLKAPAILFIIVWGILFGTAMALFVNTKIKASLHVGTITAVFMTFYKLNIIPLYALLLVPVVAWSRVMVRRHSTGEVITGFVLGTGLTIFMYVLLKNIYQVNL